jgi:hypothetical protein
LCRPNSPERSQSVIPEVAALRPRLVPEHTIYGWQMNTKGEVLVSGIADAVAANSAGKIEVIVDWKAMSS